LGFRVRGRVEKFATVTPISYLHVKAPRYARYASGEANGDNAECFYPGRLAGLAQTAIGQ